MATIRCKMCEGTLIFNEDMSIGTCEYCGSVNTVPKTNDERIMAIFERANDYRFRSEFDRAAASYESILLEDNGNAEAHWGMVLCKYGIEYVEDPTTKRRIPTCHRTQFNSIFEDIDYKAAIEHADIMSRPVYEEEAKAIDNLQQRILDISRKEEPFDVFICYKETDERKERTRDSVLAQELYNLFTKEGLKVFYAPVTLESKLGSEYEPYIFAALNSAPVMTVVTTCPENVNSVWVKNEWSRYLALIKAGAEKTLIPCYRDMDPYDLPREFGSLQALDMAKLGFMQDLLHGVKKLLGKAEVKGTAAGQVAAPGVESLQKRGIIFLSDGEWEQANEYFDKVLDIDPEYVSAYIGKLLAELQLRNEAEFETCAGKLDISPNYKRIFTFGDEATKAKFEEYNRVGYYNLALSTMKRAKTHETPANAANDFASAAKTFLAPQLTDYKDSERKAEECVVEEKERLYQVASDLMDKSKTNDDFALAAEAFVISKLQGYKDSARKAQQCRDGEERVRLRLYHEAVTAMQSGSRDGCTQAIRLFLNPAISSFRDSVALYDRCNEALQMKWPEKMTFLRILIGMIATGLLIHGIDMGTYIDGHYFYLVPTVIGGVLGLRYCVLHFLRMTRRRLRIAKLLKIQKPFNIKAIKAVKY